MLHAIATCRDSRILIFLKSHSSVDAYIHDDQQNEGDEAEDEEVCVDQIELHVVRVEPHLCGLDAQKQVCVCLCPSLWCLLW